MKILFCSFHFLCVKFLSGFVINVKPDSQNVCNCSIILWFLNDLVWDWYCDYLKFLKNFTSKAIWSWSFLSREVLNSGWICDYSCFLFSGVPILVSCIFYGINPFHVGFLVTGAMVFLISSMHLFNAFSVCSHVLFFHYWCWYYLALFSWHMLVRNLLF